MTSTAEANDQCSWCIQVKKRRIPSRELTYPPDKAYLKMIFLFPRWDMLIPWRVYYMLSAYVLTKWIEKNSKYPRHGHNQWLNSWPDQLDLPLFLHRWKRLKTSPNLDGIIPWPAELRVCQHLLQDLEAFTTWGGLWFYDDSYSPVNASICTVSFWHAISFRVYTLLSLSLQQKDELRTIGGWFSKLHEGNLRTFSRVTKHSIVLAMKAGTAQRPREKERRKKHTSTFGVKGSLPTSTAYSVADMWHSDPSPPCSQR